jgi:hypothetical protein
MGVVAALAARSHSPRMAVPGSDTSGQSPPGGGAVPADGSALDAAPRSLVTQSSIFASPCRFNSLSPALMASCFSGE